MNISGLKDVTIGVGHLRRQVDFYTTHLGMRVQQRGRVSETVCRALWQLDDELNAVILGRSDLPQSLRLRLIPVFDLPDRPDFDVRRPGPLGLFFATSDIQRVHSRLSSAGVEFHSTPVAVGPSGLKGRRYGRSVAFGRAYDGEYLVLAQPTHGPLLDGTVSPYFGVTEPLEISFVVPELEPASRFLRQALGFRSLRVTRRAGRAREQAMGLPPGTDFSLEILQIPGTTFRLALICFEFDLSVAVHRPPNRGINCLRFQCRRLDAALESCRHAGATPLGPALEVRDLDQSPALAASVPTPFGVLIELWQPLESPKDELSEGPQTIE